MTNLLQIGGVTADMRKRLETAFTIHQLDDFDPSSITHVITNGHDGIDPAIMASLINLKAISGYGVGYDAIDVAEAVRRGIAAGRRRGWRCRHTPYTSGEQAPYSHRGCIPRRGA